MFLHEINSSTYSTEPLDSKKNNNQRLFLHCFKLGHIFRCVKNKVLNLRCRNLEMKAQFQPNRCSGLAV